MSNQQNQRPTNGRVNFGRPHPNETNGRVNFGRPHPNETNGGMKKTMGSSKKRKQVHKKKFKKTIKSKH